VVDRDNLGVRKLDLQRCCNCFTANTAIKDTQFHASIVPSNAALFSNERISGILYTMQETSRYAVGIDIGTTTVRCVVGHIDPTTKIPTIVGVGSAQNSGMRKGVVAHLAGPGKTIDT